MRKNLKKILTVFFFIFSTGVIYTKEFKIKELTKKEQEIILISAFTSRGDLERLKIELNKGIDSGLSVNEIKEILIQMYAYCGFPRSLNAINTFMNVLKERNEKGLKSEEGIEPNMIDSNQTMLEIGSDIQTTLVGTVVTGEIYEFVPAIDKFLKVHLFGEIFSREVLNYQERELATIGALAVMNGAEPQLQAHLGIAKNTGLTDAKLQEAIKLIDSLY